MTGTIVAVLQRRGRFWIAEPLFPQRNAPGGSPRRPPRRRITLASNRLSGKGGSAAKEGDLVLVRLASSHRVRTKHDGKPQLLRVIGKPDVARDVIESIMLDRGLARSFERSIEAEAEEAARGAGGLRGRRDLRELPTFTIDPADARDFDDAVSARQLPDGRALISVHIADVSAYVKEGSSLDIEARKRALSVYAPGAVEPMLPHALSDDACSLLPGRDRLAVTVEITIDGEEAVGAAFFRSVIRSDQRLEYERVDRIFAGLERPSDPWAQSLQVAREAASRLRRGRERRAGALTLDSPEPEFAFDSAGHVSEVAARLQTECHTLIEHLMIAANEAVAQRLQRMNVPCLYRVHEAPQPQRVQQLVDQLSALDVPTPPVPARMSSSQANELVGEVSRAIEAHVERLVRRSLAGEKSIPRSGGKLAFTGLVLRALQQAFYSPRNVGHAGLGSACYCHFTSPIRRYPDIVCHRALLSTIEGDQPPPPKLGLVELGQWASERERDAMGIERDADDVALAFALESSLLRAGLETELDGEVVGLISAGAFVAFEAPSLRSRDEEPPNGLAPPYRGMLPMRTLLTAEGDRDWWELDEQGTTLFGERSGQRLRLGGAACVHVSRVDSIRGRVDLAPAFASGTPRSRRAGRVPP